MLCCLAVNFKEGKVFKLDKVTAVLYFFQRRMDSSVDFNFFIIVVVFSLVDLQG